MQERIERGREAATLLDSSGGLDATIDAASRPLASTLTSRTASHTAAPLGAGRSTGPRTVLPPIESLASPRSAEPNREGMPRPRFQIRRPLGEGGIGQVFAALDHDIGREVAIKSLRHEMQAAPHVARFVDEIRTVGALEHPNIVPIHDVGVDEDGSLYFVMRCVQGKTLESIIERLQAGDLAAHRHWTMERRCHVFRQLLDAVAFAHERGFVHRDIKPANVMVGEHGEVFLMDWGIARPLGASERPDSSADRDPPGSNPQGRATATSAGTLIGTPAYMSPEQARGEPVDARSDIYSLCVLFHELLSLRHYLEHCRTIEAVLDGVQHAHAAAPSFVSNAHQSPAPMDLSWFVRKGLAKHAAGRYQTVREMIDRLDAREEGIVPIQCHVTFTKRVNRELLRAVDRHPMIFTCVLALLVVGTFVGIAWRLVRIL